MQLSMIGFLYLTFTFSVQRAFANPAKVTVDGVTHTQTFASTITPAPGNWFAMPNEWKHVPGITMAAFQASKALAEVQPPSLSTWCSMSKLYSFVDIKSRGLPKQGNWNEEGGNSPPCCGVCLLGAEEAKMIFWPTPGPKNISILATDSFTFTAPSPYVAFRSLFATDRCGKSYGHQIQTTTVGIKPGHLSKIWYEPFGPITEYFDVHSSAMNFEELATCKNFGDPHLSVGSNCRPFINIPPEVNSLRNEWATCSPFYHGVIDPPMALTPGPHLTVPAHIDPPPTPQPEHQPGPPAPPLITASPPSPPPPPPPPPPPSLPDHAPQPAPAPPNNPPAPPAPPPVKDNNPASAPAPIPAHNDPPAPVPAPADPRPPTHAPSPAGPGVRPPKSGGEAPAPVQENKPPVKPNNPAPRPPIVIAGNTIKAPSDPAPSAITIDSHTIHAGGPAVIVKGTPVSLAPSGVVVVGDHQSITLAPPPPAAPAAFVAEGQTFNIIPPSDPAPKPNGEGGADKLEVANPPPTLVVGGQTLSAGGGAVTVDGTSISLGTDVLVVGTKTQSLAPLITAADGAVGSGGDGIGNMIISQWSGLGPNPSSPVTNGTDSVTPFSGDAMAVGVGRRLGLWIMAVALLMAWR